MKISVITISFNNGETIGDTINSVLSQTFKDVEYNVIDGLSTDNTIDVISAHKIGIHQFVSEKDKGIYDALNKGIQLAKGDVIGFLHADDIFHESDSLRKLNDYFERTGADVVYCDLVYVSKQDVNKSIRYWKSKPFKLKNLKYGWMPAHPTFYCKRSVFEKHGLFDLKYRIAADYDFMTRVLKDESLKVSYLPEILIKMRVGGESNKSIANIVRKSKEDYQVISSNRLGGFFTLFCKNFRKIPQFILKNKI